MPSPLTVEIAKILDGARADRRPRVDISELSRQSGIERSMLSRMLKPEKAMLVDELVAVCTALGLDAGRVIDEARGRVLAATSAAGPSDAVVNSEGEHVPPSVEGIETTKGPKIVTPTLRPRKPRKTGTHSHGRSH